MPSLYTVRDVARAAGVGDHQVTYYLRTGRLKCERAGGRPIFTQVQYDRAVTYLRDLRERGVAEEAEA